MLSVSDGNCTDNGSRNTDLRTTQCMPSLSQPYLPRHTPIRYSFPLLQTVHLSLDKLSSRPPTFFAFSPPPKTTMTVKMWCHSPPLTPSDWPGQAINRLMAAESKRFPSPKSSCFTVRGLARNHKRRTRVARGRRLWDFRKYLCCLVSAGLEQGYYGRVRLFFFFFHPVKTRGR